MMLMVPIASTFRLSDSVREGERLKGQIEEKEREIVVLMRRLEVRCIFSYYQKLKTHQ